MHIVTDPLYHSIVFLEIPRIQLGKYILLHLTDTYGALVLSHCQRSTGALLGNAKTDIHQHKQSPPALHWKNELKGLNNKLDKGVRFQLVNKKVKERKKERR